MMFTAPSSGGFTLPQLLLTLIVMAILLAISLPAYQNHVRKSKLQQSLLHALARHIAGNRRIVAFA